MSDKWKGSWNLNFWFRLFCTFQNLRFQFLFQELLGNHFRGSTEKIGNTSVWELVAGRFQWSFQGCRSFPGLYSTEICFEILLLFLWILFSTFVFIVLLVSRRRIVLYFSCLYLTETYKQHAGYSVQEANQRHLSHLVPENNARVRYLPGTNVNTPFSQVPTLEFRHKSGYRVPVRTPFLLVLGKSCTALYTLLSSCFKMVLNRVKWSSWSTQSANTTLFFAVTQAPVPAQENRINFVLVSFKLLFRQIFLSLFLYHFNTCTFLKVFF